MLCNLFKSKFWLNVCLYAYLCVCQDKNDQTLGPKGTKYQSLYRAHWDGFKQNKFGVSSSSLQKKKEEEKM